VSSVVSAPARRRRTADAHAPAPSPTVVPSSADPWRLAGNQATGRLRSRAAAIGFSEFPHADRIRQALGVSRQFAAVVNPSGCHARATRAFTDGVTTHFATPSPDLHVAAHEAAHQLQHAGVTNDLGLGAEGHASAVANAVRAGAPARRLIGPHGQRVRPAVRHYVETNEYGGWGRLAETGETLTHSGHDAYATPALIAGANGILFARRSGISLSSGGGGPTVTAPDGSGSKALSKVEVRMDSDPTGETFYSDCRQAAEEVMGGKGEDVVERVYARPGGMPVGVTPPEKPLDYAAMVLFIDERVLAQPGYAEMSQDEKLEAIRDAQSAWDWADREVKEAYRKKAVDRAKARDLGINEFATPRVGEAYAVFPDKPAGQGEYKFHYATVVMAAGADSVTFENAGGARDEKTRSWKFETYGPPHKPEQTFHGQWTGFGEHRKTLRLGNQPPPPAGAEQFRRLPTRELLSRLEASTNENERSYLEQELAHRVAYAWVEVHEQEDLTGDDEVMVLFSTGFGSLQAGGAVAIPEGQSHVFTMPITRLIPLANPLVVSVYDFDVEGDDLIGAVSWAKPYGPRSNIALAGHGARYSLTLSL
jgi:hypothetical protein